MTETTTPALADLYGHERSSWVYCWRCNTAISLADRADGPVSFTERLGLAHKFCPRPGTSPSIPEYLRIERDDYWVKHHVRKPS